MIGKTVDDIVPPIPMRPDRDPLEAENRFVHNPRPRPRNKRPADYVSESLRDRSTQPPEAN